jgi:hypothetical protein
VPFLSSIQLFEPVGDATTDGDDEILEYPEGLEAWPRRGGQEPRRRAAAAQPAGPGAVRCRRSGARAGIVQGFPAASV